LSARPYRPNRVMVSARHLSVNEMTAATTRRTDHPLLRPRARRRRNAKPGPADSGVSIRPAGRPVGIGHEKRDPLSCRAK